MRKIAFFVSKKSERILSYTLWNFQAMSPGEENPQQSPSSIRSNKTTPSPKDERNECCYVSNATASQNVCHYFIRFIVYSQYIYAIIGFKICSKSYYISEI